MLFYAHKCCWKVANSPRIIPSLKWLRMAIQTRPFSLRTRFWDREPKFDVGTDLLAADRRFFNQGTHLGKIALSLSTMPLEVQSQILDDLESSLFISLLRAKTFSSQILPRISDPTTLQPITRVLNPDATIRSIHVRFANILGRTYLAEIGFNDEFKDGSSLILMPACNVRGLRFALGKFGLRGLQVIYDDGSSSSWLGDSSSCWIGVVYGRDLSKLRIIADVSFSAIDTENREAMNGLARMT